MHSHRRPRVLLVDDEPRVCAALAGVFVSEGYDVVYEEDSEHAVVRLHERPFDIALLDLNLPGTDGWEVFDQIKAADPSMPVIIITALSGQHQKAVAAGVVALMEKPLDIGTLLNCVSGLIGKNRRGRSRGLAPASQSRVLARRKTES